MNLPLTVPDLLTLTGMTGLLYMLTATVHSAQLLPSRRFLPLLAMGLGSAIGAAAAMATGASVADAVLLGVVSGMLSSGAEETRKGVAEATMKVREQRMNRQLDEFATLDWGSWDEIGAVLDDGSSGEPPSD